MGEFDDLLAAYGGKLPAKEGSTGEFDDLLRKYQDSPEAPSSRDEDDTYWNAIKRYTLAPVQGIVNASGALVGKGLSAIAPEAYERARAANLAGIDDPNVAQELATAPAAGQVIAEAIAPGEPENPWARTAKNVGGIVGDIALDPLTYLTGGIAGGAKLVGAAGKLTKGAKLGAEAAEALVRAKRALPVGPLAEAGAKEAASLAAKGKAGLYTRAAGEFLSSAPAGAAYLPELAQGVTEGAKATYQDFSEGNINSGVARGVETMLMGGLGGLMAKGIIDERTALKAYQREKARSEGRPVAEEESPNELTRDPEDEVIDLTPELQPQEFGTRLKKPEFIGDNPEQVDSPIPIDTAFPPGGRPEPPQPADINDLGRGLGNLAKRKGIIRDPNAAQEVSPVVQEAPAEPTDAPQPDWMLENQKGLVDSLHPDVLPKIEELAAQRKTAEEISKELGITVDQVRAARTKLGIPSQAITGPMGAGYTNNPDFETWINNRSKKAPRSPSERFADRTGPTDEELALINPEREAALADEDIRELLGEESLEKLKSEDQAVKPDEEVAQSSQVVTPEEHATLKDKSAAELRDIFKAKGLEIPKKANARQLRRILERAFEEVQEKEKEERLGHLAPPEAVTKEDRQAVLDKVKAVLDEFGEPNDLRDKGDNVSKIVEAYEASAKGSRQAALRLKREGGDPALIEKARAQAVKDLEIADRLRPLVEGLPDNMNLGVSQSRGYTRTDLLSTIKAKVQDAEPEAPLKEDAPSGKMSFEQELDELEEAYKVDGQDLDRTLEGNIAKAVARGENLWTGEPQRTKDQAFLPWREAFNERYITGANDPSVPFKFFRGLQSEVDTIRSEHGLEGTGAPEVFAKPQVQLLSGKMVYSDDSKGSFNRVYKLGKATKGEFKGQNLVLRISAHPPTEVVREPFMMPLVKTGVSKEGIRFDVLPEADKSKRAGNREIDRLTEKIEKAGYNAEDVHAANTGYYKGELRVVDLGAVNKRIPGQTPAQQFEHKLAYIHRQELDEGPRYSSPEKATAAAKAAIPEMKSKKVPTESISGKTFGEILGVFKGVDEAVKRGVRTIRQTIRDDFWKRGMVSLVGARLDPHDWAGSLALLNRVNRAPFEIFHIVALKKGKVVFHNAFTSRMASSVSFKGPEIEAIMAKLAAMKEKGEIDGWIDMHNHPGGTPKASSADVNSSKLFRERFGDSYLGAVITDHEKFGYTDGKDIKSNPPVRFSDEQMKVIGPDHVFDAPLQGRESRQAIAQFAKTTQGNNDAPIVVYLSNGMEIRAVQSIPLTTMGNMDFTKSYLKANAARFGGGFIMLYHGSTNPMARDTFRALSARLIHDGVILDAAHPRRSDADFKLSPEHPANKENHLLSDEPGNSPRDPNPEIPRPERVMEELDEDLAPEFYSAVQKAVESLPSGSVYNGPQLLARLKGMQGIKLNELKWSGLEEFLKSKEKVSRVQVLDFLEANNVAVEIKTVPEAMRKFESYTEPGGKDYKEWLITLPQSTARYKGPHWDDFKNVLAHMRTTTRTDESGAKVLFIEEIQSDWGQALRHDKNRKIQLTLEEGLLDGKPIFYAVDMEDGIAHYEASSKQEVEDYINKGKTAIAPFLDSTEKWTTLAAKKMLRHAAENGYDRVAWTTGEQQNARYDLSKHVEKIAWNEDLSMMYITRKGGREEEHVPQRITKEDLPNYVGKEAADRLLDQTKDNVGYRTLQGIDLKIGGSGMKGYYDKIVPTVFNKLGKPWGVKVDETPIDFRRSFSLDGFVDWLAENPDTNEPLRDSEGDLEKFKNYVGTDEYNALLREFKNESKTGGATVVQSVAISPAMKSSVLHKGQALFQELDEPDRATIARKAIYERQPKDETVFSKEELSELLKTFLATPDPEMAKGKPQGTPDIALTPEKFALMSPELRARVGATLKLANDHFKRSDPKEWNKVKMAEDINNSILQKHWLDVDERREKWLKDKTLENQEALELAIVDAAVTTSLLKDPVTKAARILAAQKEAHKLTASGHGLMMSRFLKSLRQRGLSKEQVAALEKIFKTRPGDFGEALRDALKPKFSDKFMEWWISGLVSAPTTRVANVGSNTIFRGLRDTEDLVAVGLDKARVAFFGGERKRFLDEAKLVTQAYKDALFGTDGSNGAIHDWISNRGGFTLEDLKIDPDQRLSDINPGRAAGGAIKGTFGQVVRIPFKGLEVDDAFFKHLAKLREIYKIAVRDAYAENAKDPLGRAKEIAAEILHVIEHKEESHLFEVHGPKLNKIHEAMLRDTFQSPLEGILRAIERLQQDHALVKIILPFVKTPGNIAREAIQRTPFGFWTAYRRLNREFAGGKIDSGRLADEMAKPLVGSVLGAAFALAASEGLLTGGGPGDYQKEEALRRTGWQPYSIHIGDQYLSFQRLEPFASIMGMAADLAEGVKQGKTQNPGELAQRIVGSVTENLTSKTFLAGLEGFFTMWHDPLRFGERWIKQLEGSLVPNVVGAAARAVDPVYRKTTVGLDPLKAKIPGLSQTLPAQTTPTGEDRKRPGTPLERFLSPISRTTEDRSPEGDVAREMVKIDYVPRNIPEKVVIKGVTIPLSRKDQLVLTNAQKKATLAMAKVMKDKGYLRLPDNQDDPNWKLGMTTKRDVAEKTYRKYMAAARAQINPALLKSLLEPQK